MKRLVLIATFLAYFALTTESFALSYKVVPMAPVPTDANGQGQSLNNLGQVVGSGDLGDMPPPALFTGTAVLPLGIAQGCANDINDSGDIVGYVVNNSGSIVPFLYSGGVMQTLAVPGVDVEFGSANGINNRGEVVGLYVAVDQEHNAVSGAFLYTAGVMQSIDVGDVSANAINNVGQIAGRFSNGGFLYANGVAEPPPSVPGLVSIRGNAINDHGDVAGLLVVGNHLSDRHAFVYSGGVVHDLGSGEAISINNLGQTLISRPDGYELYTGGQFLRLSGLLIPPDWYPSHFYQFIPSSINDVGQISGTGYWGFGNQAALLVPVPEPSSLLLAAVGAAAITIHGRRFRDFRRET